MMPVMAPEEKEEGKHHSIPSHTRLSSISPVSSELQDTSHLQALRAVLVGSWRVRGDGNHPIGLLGLESLAF